MRKKSLFNRFMLGFLIGALIMPAQPARAQFGGIVFDAKNYALQVQKKIEEAYRYVQMFETAVAQYTTLTGMLGKFEEVVANQRNMVRTMSDIGQTVRAIIQVKEQVQAIVYTRLTMLTNIDNRLRNGVLNPEADLSDFEDYLRNSIGRTSENSLANLERLRNMDNTLERMNYDLKLAAAGEAKAAEELITYRRTLDLASDQQSIDTLTNLICNCMLRQMRYHEQVIDLQEKIKERCERYSLVNDERYQFYKHINDKGNGWDAMDNVLDKMKIRTQADY
jgi:hypothetical protein